MKAGEVLRAEVCVIGAGAAGITVAMELGRNGVDTLVIPGGGRRYSSRYQRLYKGTSADGIPLERSRQRRFGGTTAVWGGRCLPLTSIDFEERAFVKHSGWPLSASDLVDYYLRSQEYLDLGSTFSFNVATALPGSPPHLIEGFKDDVLLTDGIEKWSLPTDLGKKYYAEIAASSSIRVVMDAHLTRIHYTGIPGDVSAVSCTAGGAHFMCEATSFVLAMGGLEVTRHLLQPNDHSVEGVGNGSGMLGKCFMTHFSGEIAEVVIDERLAVLNRYEKDRDGVYCRRLIKISEETQKELEVLNFDAFLHHPAIEDPRHRDPLLSLLFLVKGVRSVALRIPPEYSVRLADGRFRLRDYLAHLRNVVLGLPRLLVTAPTLIYLRLLRRRKLPSIIVPNKRNRFTLHYHVEHAPHPESRVTLSNEKDEHGLRRLHVSMHYESFDVESVLRTHEVIRERLERAGVGTLHFLSDDPIAHIKKQIGFGGHQLGTTRMALREEDGVVDPNCRVFGMANMYVASPSVFPTGGEANPVLSIVALAIRLADYLRETNS